MSSRIEYVVKKPSEFVQSHMANVENNSKFLNELLEKYFKGKLVEGSDIDIKIKKQQYLKLCLQNWKELKSHSNFEDAKKILLNQKEIDEPEIKELENLEDTEQNTVDRNCMCGHVHVDTVPHVCSEPSCNCGIRG